MGPHLASAIIASRSCRRHPEDAAAQDRCLLTQTRLQPKEFLRGPKLAKWTFPILFGVTGMVLLLWMLLHQLFCHSICAQKLAPQS